MLNDNVVDFYMYFKDGWQINISDMFMVYDRVQTTKKMSPIMLLNYDGRQSSIIKE